MMNATQDKLNLALIELNDSYLDGMITREVWKIRLSRLNQIALFQNINLFVEPK